MITEFSFAFVVLWESWFSFFSFVDFSIFSVSSPLSLYHFLFPFKVSRHFLQSHLGMSLVRQQQLFSLPVSYLRLVSSPFSPPFLSPLLSIVLPLSFSRIPLAKESCVLDHPSSRCCMSVSILLLLFKSRPSSSPLVIFFSLSFPSLITPPIGEGGW